MVQTSFALKALRLRRVPCVFLTAALVMLGIIFWQCSLLQKSKRPDLSYPFSRFDYPKAFVVKKQATKVIPNLAEKPFLFSGTMERLLGSFVFAAKFFLDKSNCFC